MMQMPSLLTPRRFAKDVQFAIALLAITAVAVSCRTPVPQISTSSRSTDISVAAVSANDNRVPAGKLVNGKLDLRLVIGMARWYPEASDGAWVDVAAFAEEGGKPQIPSPLIRVPIGTTIVATLRNSLADSTVYIYGLGSPQSGTTDTLSLAPGQSRTVTFAAAKTGTYLYYATLGRMDRIVLRPNPQYRRRIGEREQLAGAFIIDSVNANTNDRIMVINGWSDPPGANDFRNALSINGKAWPHTERLVAQTGDSVRWRILNGSARNHPMHLHGFYFRVDSRGSLLRDSTYAAADRRLVVTEVLAPGETMSMVWAPERPGNWLFHCHAVFHVVDEARLTSMPRDLHTSHGAKPMEHMAGLVMGVSVRPASGFVGASRGPARQLNLFVNEGKPRGIAPRALSFVLQEGNKPPADDSVVIPGSPLILRRGEPTDVRVVNRLAEETSIHWHGIELDSYSDGVAGFSGDPTRLSPAIPPKGSFIAQLTLPRAGTFIYHTHLNDLEQLTSGLYGALIVLERGQRYDPSTDHLFVAGWDGESVPGTPGTLIVNGGKAMTPLPFALGKTHRLRFVNIGPAVAFVATLRRDSTVATWRRRAKDGADLPAGAAQVVPASLRADVGETFDTEFTPTVTGAYTLSIAHAGQPVRYLAKITVK